MISLISILEALKFARMAWGVASHPTPKRSRIIPTRENPAPGRTSLTITSRSAIAPSDQILIHREQKSVRLAWMTGCDIALRRDGRGNEWMIPGDKPSSSKGFVVVRNGGA